MSRALDYSLSTIIRRTRDFDSQPKAVQQANERGASLGIGPLAVGAAIVSIAYAVAALAFFLTTLSAHPAPLVSGVAWLLHIASLAGTLMTLRRGGRDMPTW